MSVSSSKKPTVLVLGSTGQIGKLIVQELAHSSDVHLRLSARRPEKVEEMRKEGKKAVHLDLDDPKTFALALSGVDRVFLLTGYTVAMLTQSKTFIDSAVRAGVKHIVHLGIFGEWDCTDPHFVWHQLIESYIKASGLAWTHLHPNMFMDNLLSATAPKGDKLSLYFENRRVGFVAVSDIAAIAAAVLGQGPEKHNGRDYWMSCEVLDGTEIAAILSEVTGRRIAYDPRGPDDFKALVSSPDSGAEAWYAEGGVDFMRQVCDGRMGYIGTIRDDIPYVLGRPALTFREWASAHKDKFN
ncbi:NmrA family protein [Plenodomus tracheiphilus IPT5]|uniref:NmrA family protein n=1 Tax=Plenodomus tracheiphilus IPT5 TaxID=1408161 RepID=A0A6A7BCA8_9PLEO|nr:NmrA family protein [Plenodomus tracheiphilus IPT5]